MKLVDLYNVRWRKLGEEARRLLEKVRSQVQPLTEDEVNRICTFRPSLGRIGAGARLSGAGQARSEEPNQELHSREDIGGCAYLDISRAKHQEPLFARKVECVQSGSCSNRNCYDYGLCLGEEPK